MEKSIQGILTHGLVAYKGLLFPKQVKVSLFDSQGVPGNRAAPVTLLFEITEERLKCISLTAHASADNRSISSSLLRDINVEKIGEDALASLALELKVQSDEEVTPAPLSKGRRASKELVDGLQRLTLRELMFIGFHYSNPLNAASPTKAVWHSLGYGSRHTALRRIEEARSKGWVLGRDATREQIDAHFEIIRKRLEDSNGAAS
jgi:hypothetical protein